jgi:MFS family permease
VSRNIEHSPLIGPRVPWTGERHATARASSTAQPKSGDQTGGESDGAQPGVSPAGPKKVSLWSFPLVVLGLVNFVDHVDMAILRGVLPLIGDHFQLDDARLGLLGLAFVFVNVLASIPAGWIADHYNRARVIGYTLLSWSGLSLLSAAAFNYPSLLAARAIMGFGQAIDDPASTSLIGDFFPPHARGRVFSVQQVAVFVGSAVGLMLAGLVGSLFGWRWAFVIVGMPGSLVAFAAFRLREPMRGESEDVGGSQARSDPVRIGAVAPPRSVESGSGSTQGGSDPGGMGRDAGDGTESVWAFLGRASVELAREVGALLRIRTMRYILIGAATLLFTVQGIGFWLAVFHQRYSGMSLRTATAATGLILGTAGIIGTLWGGSLADRLLQRKGYRARIDMSVAMIVTGATCFFFSWILDFVPGRLVLQFLGMVVIATVPPTLRASTMDVVPPGSRGVGSSAFAVVTAVFGTAFAPAAVGWLSKLTSLRTAFILVSPPILVGTLILWRARFTIVDDARAMMELLVRSRSEAASSR